MQERWHWLQAVMRSKVGSKLTLTNEVVRLKLDVRTPPCLPGHPQPLTQECSLNEKSESAFFAFAGQGVPLLIAKGVRFPDLVNTCLFSPHPHSFTTRSGGWAQMRHHPTPEKRYPSTRTISSFLRELRARRTGSSGAFEGNEWAQMSKVPGGIDSRVWG